MKIIPISATPSQVFSIVLGTQNCTIKVYQKSTGTFLDLALAGTPLLTGVLCQDRVRLVRQAYLGFSGDLAFMDTQGFDVPQYQGLGSRWQLMYLEPSDL
ncbi:hypothetical protein PF66_06193 [Pseudomonas asplenii]|uniref:Cyanophage baseplate Pam3 plug gp18 domain-containing protein n=1 Tax=Pseudomonas asplenii TaxID=53407 RepID=A0A0N0E151_9PSED|nr:hypothetical protein [Pseudomonas fuscovaginae]KPA87283.1 hypothetical protein PF66_06193 [Pseudomonas fuscovaginae]